MQAFRRGNPLADRLVLAALLTCLTLLLVELNWMWRIDRVLYDAQLRLWSRPPAENIIIIAIDEESLARLGRWPWSREVHAELLDILTRENPHGVAFDIIFSEPDQKRPAEDSRFAAAIRNNARVFLPVVIEQPRLGGQFIEVLPLPELADAARGMGHVHIELDEDGIARSVYLKEGLGSPYWETITLAMLGLVEPVRASALQRSGNDSKRSATTGQDWTRDIPFLIPFTGPPGHYHRISYHQVLSGNFLPGTFRDKYVLIGTTAVGLGDILPTPLSGYSHPMPGVEINANILDSLQRNIVIRPAHKAWQLGFAGLFSLLPFFLFHRFIPRTNLLITLFLALGAITGSFALLTLLEVWLPPTAALFAVLLSYPLWNSRRLENALAYLGLELQQFNQQEADLRSVRQMPVEPALEFIGSILSLKGWCLVDDKGTVLTAQGNCFIPEHVPLTPGEWTRQAELLLSEISVNEQRIRLGLHWPSEHPPTDKQQALLDALLLQYRERKVVTPYGSFEVVQARIEEVQEAANRLRAVYEFIDNSLAHMADGIIVTDRFGRVILSNPHANQYLNLPGDADLKGRLVTQLLEDLHPQEQTPWNSVLRRVLLEGASVQMNARHTQGRDLLVQITPLPLTDEQLSGITLTLSDISQLKTSERRRSEALSFLSHDLRSPLVSQLALLELAKSRELPGELNELITRMESYATSTIQLSEQFLQLARAESEDELVFHDVDLLSLAHNATEEVWGSAQAKDVVIRQAFEPEEAWIRGDAGLLERSIINLLNNAIKYSPGQRVVTFRIARRENDYWCCVEDQGYGIPAQEVAGLFKRFQRGTSDRHQQEPGTGLGLALVKATAEAHHGRVEVESTEGEGSCFCLVLPVPETEEAD